MCLCKKCSKMCGILVVLAGIGFLLQDMNVWNFFNLSWYTVVFILGGVALMGSSCCKNCQAACSSGCACGPSCDCESQEMPQEKPQAPKKRK